jgi:hypothetical protein
MTGPACPAPVAFATLVEYWLGELAGKEQNHIEEHVFGCASCTARLGELAALGEGIRAAFRGGALHAVISTGALNMMHRAGLRLREYPVAPGGSVQCTIAAPDDIVVSRLAAPLGGVERLDLVQEAEGWPELRLEDIPFDPAAGEVLFCPPAARLKSMPAHTARVRLLARVQGEEHTLAEYTFNHVPS